MKYLSALILFGMVIAGCSAQPRASESAKEVHPANPDIANVAPEGRITEEVPPSETGPSLPGMTANSPPILLTPIQGNTPEPSTEDSAATGNWQTFISSALGVTVSYPPDWTVAEETNGALFTSPTGAQIEMKAETANTNNKEFRIGNQYCTSRTNEHGQIADICVDNAAFIYTAKFSLQKADGSTQGVTLMTKTRTVGDVFETMFNSLRPTN